MTQVLNLPEAVTEIVSKRLNPSVWENYVPIVDQGCNTWGVYLCNEIMSPDVYSELLNLLVTATPNTTFEFYINTPGGNTDTAEMLYTAIKQTEGHTIANCSGTVASAGTLVTLACKVKFINPHAIFMVHGTTIEGLNGKSADLKRYQAFQSRWLSEFFTTIYGDILSSRELEQILDGEELWFTGQEMNARIVNASRITN